MKIVADLHTHSIASGHAYSTIQEMAAAAREKGLAMLAITDHGPTMPGGPDLYHFGNLRVLPTHIDGVEILRGVEANIIDHNGSLDMPEFYLAKLDVVLAGLHAICYPGGSTKENTGAVLKVMANPFVDIIVHPGNPEFPLELELIVDKAVELGMAIEINNSSLLGSRKGSQGNCLTIAELVAQKGAPIVIGSDAHISFDVGYFEDALAMVLKAGVKEEQVVNSSVEKIKQYLAKRRDLRIDLNIPVV